MLKPIILKKHSKIHNKIIKINKKGRMTSNDPKLEEIKVRLYNRNKGDTKEYSLSKLINTTFVKGCFEFRGRSTGLKDKNGKLIYEGDVVEKPIEIKKEVLIKEFVVDFGSYYEVLNGLSQNHLGYGYYFKDENEDNVIGFDPVFDDFYKDVKIIGNIYEDKKCLNQ